MTQVPHLRVTWREKRFVCDCRYDEAHIPRAAGFLWDGKRREWWTRKPEVAEKLKHLWDERVVQVFSVIEQRRKAIDASRAVDADIDIPAPRGLQYLGYQKAGIAFGKDHKNMLLGDDMGLGKTIQAIGVINLDTSIRKVLIVCPASLKLNWRAELRKWLVNDRLTIGIAQGNYVPATDIVIINYDILERNRDKLLAQTWDLLVADEAHYLKNSKNKRTKALLGGEIPVHAEQMEMVATPAKYVTAKLADPVMGKLVRDCVSVVNTNTGRKYGRLEVSYKVAASMKTVGPRFGKWEPGAYQILWDCGIKRWKPIPATRKIFLTGTPIVNRPSELWTIIHALDPERWNNWRAYVTRYCGAIDKGFGVNTDGASRLDELQRILRATIMLRRLKCDVLTDLPPKMRQVIEIPPTGNAAALVDAENKATVKHKAQMEALQNAIVHAEVNKDEAGYRQAVRRLREAMQVDFAEISRLRHETAMAKLPFVIEHVQQCFESVPKIVLFAHHKDVLQGLLKAFAKDAVLLYGETTMDARQQAVERFQKDSKVRLFIGGIIPAGVGLTLTAASHVVFAELDWVPGNMTQAEDRCHRIGQRDSVLVQHLVLEGSLDAHMARVIIQKQEIIEQALDITGDAKPTAVAAPQPAPRASAEMHKPVFRVGEQGSLF